MVCVSSRMNPPSAASPSASTNSPTRAARALNGRPCAPARTRPNALFPQAEPRDDVTDALRIRVEERLERVAGEERVGPVVALQRLLPRRRLHRPRDDVDQFLALRVG